MRVIHMKLPTRAQVVAVELEERFLGSGLERIKKSLSKTANKMVEKGKLDQVSKPLKSVGLSLTRLCSAQAAADEHVASTLARISPTTNVSELSSCDILVEAVVENMKLKEKLYTYDA